jgi:hypothetical protein
MSTKLPLCVYSGTVEQLQGGDTLTCGALDITGLTLGSVLFVGSGGAVSQDNANLFWDDTNLYLGVQTATPQGMIHSKGTARVQVWESSSGATDGKLWDIDFGNGSHWKLRLVNDAYSSATSAIDVLRSGTTLTSVQVGSKLFWDEGNSRLGVGTTSPSNPLHVSVSASATQLLLSTSTTNTGMDITRTGGGGTLRLNTDGFASGTLSIYSVGSNDLALGSNSTRRLTLTSAGSVVCGSGSIATNATDGFLYLPTCAGTPTGTPTTQTGRVAMVYDTTGNKLWSYNGSWRSSAFS